MRISIALLFVAFHVVVGYPYSTLSDDCFSDGLAQGYIRYVDANGVQRLVEYNYPKPAYQHLSYESQRHATNPFLKSNVQPIYAGQEYIYQGSKDDQEAREQHFRAWNLQRYQALKNEADKLYVEGKVPSSDMLARLQQLEQFSRNAQYVYNSEQPEMRQAREEHFRLWNDARLNVLKSHITAENDNQQARDAHLRLYDQQVQLIHRYENDNANTHIRAEGPQFGSYLAAADSHTAALPILKSAGAHQAHQISAGVSSKVVSEPSQHHEQAFAGRILLETPEVQRAKEEHLRLWNIAKMRAEKADQYNAEIHSPQVAQHIDASHSPALKSAEAHQISAGISNKVVGKQPSPILKSTEAQQAHEISAGVSSKFVNEPTQHHEQSFAGRILVENPEVQHAIEQRVGNEAKIHAHQFDKSQLAQPTLKSTSETSLNQVIGAVFQQQEQMQNSQQFYEKDAQQFIETDANAFQEKIELEAEKLREMERMREEEKMVQLDALKEAERLKEEKRQMEAEQMIIKAADEARLQKDLKQQFDSEHVRKVATEIVTPSGIYFLANRYQNPFLYQYNTPAAAVRFASGQAQYLKYPGAQAYAIQGSGQQLQPSFIYNEKPAALKYIPQQYLPATINSEQTYQTKDTKDLYELEKATREHFQAHEIALKQLDLANQKAALTDCTH